MAPDTPLPYRLRSEIEWIAIRGRRRDWWLAKDPLRTSFFRCGDEVRKLLESLDGQRSINELRMLLSASRSTQRVSMSSIQAIIRSAIQKQLLVKCSQEKGSQVKSHQAERVLGLGEATPRGDWIGFIQRWPWSLVQGKRRIGTADAFLGKLARHTDWLFGIVAVSFWLAFMVISAMLVLSKLVQRESIDWPSMVMLDQGIANWLIVLFVTRIAHELGHAIVCVRMGARCREFGVFFMLGIACPYVDVTDSWRLTDPKARMAIAAAGVYVEWIIAAVAGLIWYTSHPCWLHSLAWQVLVVCSLTTLLINANPLIRYDGYFLLCDYLETVNLREEADSVVGQFIQIYLRDPACTDPLPWSWRAFGLITYSFSSWVYRASLVVALIWSVYTICLRWHLPMLGWAFAGLMIVSFLLIPIGQKMFQSWSTAIRTPTGPYRLVTIWLGIVALLVNAAWVPLPHRVACQGIVKPENQTFVYTQGAGRIASVPLQLPGPREASAPIVALDNPWTEDKARMASQRQRQLECQVASMRKAAYQEPALIDRSPTLAMLVAIADKQSQNAQNEVKALTVAKTVPGTWVPIELPLQQSLDGNVTSMRGHMIDDPESLGQWLPAGTPIGYVTPSDRVTVAATLPVSQLNHIQVGMSARVRFDQLPNEVFSAKVMALSTLSAAPDSDAENRTIRKLNDDLQDSSFSSSFSAILAIEGVSQGMLAMGGTADVLVWSTPKSLSYHIAQLASATFGPNVPQTVER